MEEEAEDQQPGSRLGTGGRGRSKGAERQAAGGLDTVGRGNGETVALQEMAACKGDRGPVWGGDGD